jgi:hypothetical protein
MAPILPHGLRRSSASPITDRFRSAATTSLAADPNGATVVQRWRRIVAEADDPESATSKLGYELLVQIRTIKLILAWVLIFIPAGAAVVLIVLTTLARSPAYSPYGYQRRRGPPRFPH